MPPKVTRPRVYARVRPMFGRDAGEAELFTISDTDLEFKKEGSDDISKYGFDRVFGMDSEQSQVYDTIGAVAIDSLRKGFNSTILAYGQTGSGKTFSMEGVRDDKGVYTSRGLIPRIFEGIFKQFSADETVKSFEVSMQFVELYNEQLQDLFGGRKVVEAKTDPTGGYQCKDAVREKMTSEADGLKKYEKGCKNRATASTNMNAVSSRSHALLIVQVAWVEQKGKSFSQLNLVDLAGSEGMKKTGASGAAMKEGIKINLSLTKLAFVVKCLSEGAKHIPFRESKLTMMLAKGLGGNNLLHIILALSNSALQITESTACLRFGQSCLSMTVNPNANAMEKEQAEMKSVIKEQMQEINELADENTRLKEELEREKESRASMTGAAIPDWMVAKHIELNKDALQDDLREADEQIDELRKALVEKQQEMETLNSADDSTLDDMMGSKTDLFEGMDAQQKAEALENRSRQVMLERMKNVAMIEQEKKAFESELEQMLEIQKKLQNKIAKSAGGDEERIQAEAAEQAAAQVAEMEEKAAALELELAKREAQAAALEAAQRDREREMEEQVAAREATLKKEAEQKKALAESQQKDNSAMKEELQRLKKEREAQEAAIKQSQAEQKKMDKLEKDAQKARAEQEKQEQQLAAMRAALEAAEAGMPTGLDAHGKLAAFGGIFRPVPEMIKAAARKLNKKAKSKKIDPKAVERVLQTLPVLVACNDLRALTELEAGNRTLFQGLGGIEKMVDFLYPHGAQAPYATHVARTLPYVMDGEGRKIFGQCATQKDREGVVKLTYLSHLLLSDDPDDKEHACLAIAAIAQDSPDNRKSLFEHKISGQVLGVLKETCQQAMPRQRLQRVAVMALSELAQDFDGFQQQIRKEGAVKMLLDMTAPTNDPYLIKETLACLGRITQNNPAIQKELKASNAIQTYSQLLFAQTLHDSAITELAALALVNLVSEAPECMATITKHPKYSAIRFEMLASMARALSSSMQRQHQNTASLGGSAEFAFWGACAAGKWEDGNAGGDRTHTSFVDNPQFLLKAPKGANLCLVLQDTLEEKRQRDRGNVRPLFLRLCITAATPEALSNRLKVLDINSSGARPASIDGDSVVQLETNVNGFIDLSKTREVAMRCHVKSAAPEDSWIIVPHVGCAHQHSRYVLSVFSDQEVSLQGELQGWNKRIITSSWTPLCCAPRSITDARWRNCPQFNLINMHSEKMPVRALLSYGERDAFLNKRHLQMVDVQSQQDERPMLSMYVMKNNVPDKRYVSTLSPQVEQYVCHSPITNSWCVQCGWSLEPGNVYSLLVVMAEGTPHDVPLRLTLYSPPDADDTEIIFKPLSGNSEWHLTAITANTDANGMVNIELASPGDGGNLQATLVAESDENAFCSISTLAQAVPYKQTPTYAHKQAVLSVPLSGGTQYTMVTRAITQRQEPIRNSPMRFLLYSTKPLDATPDPSTPFELDTKAMETMVSKTSSESSLVYGEEGMPEDTEKPQTEVDKEDEGHDPAVLGMVMKQLEDQRDNIYAFSKSELNNEPPEIIERLREAKEGHEAQIETLKKELIEANARARAGGAAPTGRKQSDPGVDGQLASAKAKLASAEKREKELKDKVTQLSKPRSEGEDLKVMQKEMETMASKLKQAEANAAAAEARSGGGGGDADEVRRLKEQNAALQKKVDNPPKSAACVVM